MQAEPHERETAFIKCALASGLVVQQDIDEARTGLRWSAGDKPDRQETEETRLPDKLVELGRINAWQARQLLDGRTKFNLGRYWIVDSIGQGGMGQVFKAAEHGGLGRIVAVKVLPRSKATPEAIHNFANEIKTQSQLNHPNLLRLIDAGEDGNVYYMVTDYVSGTDLRKMVRRNGPLTMESAAKIISQTSAGLQHAHDNGLIHRDVKPGNVLVTFDGRAKLSDLGLAGPLNADAQTDTRYGKIVGTADYLAPDHIERPWDPTAAWDIYSLGCTLYYAVTGKVPFPGGSTADKARAHCRLRPLDPRRLNQDLSAEFVEVIADMMAKDPAERTPSAADVIERLRPWTEPDAAHGPSRPLHRPGGERAKTPLPPALAGAGNLADTVANFPELPEPVGVREETSSQMSQGTAPVASAEDETWIEIRHASQSLRPMSVIRPILVLVLLPAVLVAMTLFLAWMMK